MLLPKEFPQETEIEVTWEQFELKIRGLRHYHSSKRIASPLLFRGQGNSDWGLQTTLERRKKSNMLFRDYYSVISRIKPQIEALTKGRWDILDFSSVMGLLEDYDSFSLTLDNYQFPAQQYLVHLRHHGFPSPLLDWTRSPYIAAYFAFCSEHTPSTGQVSIYCFLDAPENQKVTSRREPVVRRLGDPRQLHRRHFLQQADYTVCLCDALTRFGNHEEVVSRDTNQRYRLWKFILPWTEKGNVLSLLNDFNLNAFSLFQSEEALMETMAILELDSAGMGS